MTPGAAPDQPQVSFRAMAAEDIPQVHAIETLSFSLPWPERSFRYELVENPHSALWVAETRAPEGSRAVVGMIVLWLVVDEAHIGTIAVHPDYRRQGIGQRLLAYALLDAARRGIAAVHLEVRRGNLAAQELYRRFGFELVGVRSRYYHDNHEDALLLTLRGLDAARLRQLMG